MARIIYGDKRPYVNACDDDFYFSVEAKNLDATKAEIIRLKCDRFRNELREVIEPWEFDECGQELIISMSYSEVKA